MARTILITGCSSGIGRAAARRFAAEGWNVVATMRRPEGDRELAGINGLVVTRLDVRDRDSIRQSIATGIEHFGAIDVLVNNAGFGQYGLFEAIPRELVQEQFDVNVFGVMDVTRAILPHFRMNRAGIVINISSGAGIFTLPLISLYCASKFALEGFSEALAYELASQNIIVKLVVPHGGVTSTAFSEKTTVERGVDESLTDYEHFVAETRQAFARMNAGRTTSADEVAGIILLAATDGTSRLRYLIGDDSRGFVRARREMMEENYIEFMRSYFPHGG